jgi:hypothetical protein
MKRVSEKISKYCSGRYQQLAVGLLVFCVLLVWNCRYLNNPPYWDDILGLHNQAVWLAKNNFNVIKLWQPGQDFWQGGSNIYRFGMMPYLYGLLYTVFSPAYVHVAGHLFNMACLAVAFALFFSVLRQIAGSAVLALLWCIAAVCEPVMAGRTAALGQECPLVMLVAFVIYFVFNKRYWHALLFVMIAMLVKMTAVIPALALSVWFLTRRLLPEDLFENKDLPEKINALTIVTAFYALGSFIMLTIFEVDYTFDDWSLSLGQKLFDKLPLLVPLQFLVLVGIAVTGCWCFFTKLFKHKKITEQDWFSVFVLIMTGGFWVSFLMYPGILPRYTAMIVFPMMLLLAINLPKKVSIAAVLLLVVGGMFLNTGYLMRKLPGAHSCSGEYLERSREYLADLKQNQKVCKFLEKRACTYPILAKWPFVQMLTMPEMGYVEKPLPSVYDAGKIHAKYTKARVFPGKDKMPAQTLYVFVANSFEFWPKFGIPLMPKNGDKIIYSDNTLGGFILIYQRNVQHKQ